MADYQARLEFDSCVAAEDTDAERMTALLAVVVAKLIGDRTFPRRFLRS